MLSMSILYLISSSILAVLPSAPFLFLPSPPCFSAPCDLFPRLPSSSPVSLLWSLPHSFSFAPFFSLRFPVSSGVLSQRDYSHPDTDGPPDQIYQGQQGPLRKVTLLKADRSMVQLLTAQLFHPFSFFFSSACSVFYHTCVYLHVYHCRPVCVLSNTHTPVCMFNSEDWQRQGALGIANRRARPSVGPLTTSHAFNSATSPRLY